LRRYVPATRKPWDNPDKRAMWTNLQYEVLRRISPRAPNSCSGSAYQNKSKLRILLGDAFLSKIAGRTVIDFGCGEGAEALEMVHLGAKRVIGIDNREQVLEIARSKAIEAGVQDNSVFASATGERADIIVSIDSFEHFADPAAILHGMSTLLKPRGEVMISFGPTWYHPLGGHLFSVFPWAHILFSEEALIRWRSTFKTDGATRFNEVAGGLNQMTIGRFEKLVEKSAFNILSLELIPIAKLRPFHGRLTREFTTAIVRCHLALS
jgi:SAM-dependent methyltransferase